VTATDTSTWQACRHCGALIRPSALGAHWIDADNYDHCEDTGNSHEPASVCRVVDQILHWVDKDGQLNIAEGDLVLYNYKLELVEQIHYTLSTHIRVRVEFAGRNTAVFADPHDLVAVRRYITEET
jgi:hypothetical protein